MLQVEQSKHWWQSGSLVDPISAGPQITLSSLHSLIKVYNTPSHSRQLSEIQPNDYRRIYKAMDRFTMFSILALLMCLSYTMAEKVGGYEKSEYLFLNWESLDDVVSELLFSNPILPLFHP